MITGVYNSLIYFVIINFWMLMWNMKYSFFQLKKTPNPLCFPFSYDNLSSEKCLRCSFSGAGIDISPFGDPHHSYFWGHLWSAQARGDSWWTHGTINASLHAATLFCHLPVCLVAAVFIMNPAGLSQKNQEQFFPGGCLPSNKIN